MTDKTGIEWTDATWNPIRGCSRVSDGCRNCYAETQAARIQRCDRGRGIPEGQGSYDGLLARGGQWNGQIRIADHLIDQPLRWQGPRRVFVNSMSDLFHPGVPESVIDQIFAVMALCPQHTFQVLTKRPERMRDYINAVDRDEAIGFAGKEIYERTGGRGEYRIASALINGPGRIIPHPAIPVRPDVWPLPNVWLGVSVENQATANARIPALQDTDAAVRWLSMEPLLGCVDIDALADRDIHASWDGIDWVVVGGESGPGARPMDPAWVRDLRRQCRQLDIPFFFKQWGGESKKARGRTLDGREYSEFPEAPNA